MTTNQIFITGRTTTVAIPQVMYKKFCDVFWSEKVYNFHVIQKHAIGDEIVFEIRSMRVNEFCDILDLNGIKWNLK